MKMIRKLRSREDGAGYWASFSDLMSGILIVFILLFIYKLYDYQESMSQKEQMIQDLSSTRIQIISMLKEEFQKENIDIIIDPKTGAITLSEGILFDSGKSELKPEGEEFLKNFIPIYLKILLSDQDIKSHISQIIIEGHTDTKSTYIYNLKLSQERAFSVVEFLLSDEFQYSNREELQKYLTANGRSYSETIKKDDGAVNEDASRRVEIKFRLNEEETLLKIQDELKKGIK